MGKLLLYAVGLKVEDKGACLISYAWYGTADQVHGSVGLRRRLFGRSLCLAVLAKVSSAFQAKCCHGRTETTPTVR